MAEKIFLPFKARDVTWSVGLFSTDNFYDEKLGKYLGEEKTVSTFGYDFKNSKDDVLEIDNFFIVKTNDGEEFVRIERSYGIDKLSGKHVKGYGDKDRDGYLFAPRNERAVLKR